MINFENEYGEAYFLLIGDHGGGSFKLLLQNLNKEKPSSILNGILVGEMEVSDSHYNLKAAFGHYQRYIDLIQDKEIKFEKNGKEIKRIVRLFLGGDYEFLCENFGHPGAASKFFCLWCPISNEDKFDDPNEMDVVWGEGELIRNVREYNPIFSFDLSRVVVLPLHILLGVVKCYLVMLQNEVLFLYYLFASVK